MHSLNLMEVQGVASGSGSHGVGDTLATPCFNLDPPGGLSPCLDSIGSYLLGDIATDVSLSVNYVTDVPIV